MIEDRSAKRKLLKRHCCSSADKPVSPEGSKIAPTERPPSRRSLCFSVPELIRIANIQVNERVSSQRGTIVPRPDLLLQSRRRHTPLGGFVFQTLRWRTSRKPLSPTAFCELLHISVASRELSFRKSSLAANLARRYSFSETGNLFVRHLLGFALGYHSLSRLS